MAARTGMRLGRWLARIALVAASMVGLLITAAAPALAHAELEGTTPVAESVLHASPRLITLTFDEGVFPAADAIRLYDDRLAAVAVGTTFHPHGVGKLVAAPVPETLAAGTYTVVWRVTSDDGHVVAGQFVFSVGHRTPVSGVPPGTRHDTTTSVLAAVARGLGYVGLVTGPGALVVMAWLWPGGFARRRIRLLLGGGGLMIVIASALAVWVQGAAAAGVSVGHALNGADLRLGMAGHFGRAIAGRFVLLMVLLWLTVTGWRSDGSGGTASGPGVPARRVSVASAGLAAMWPFAGHADVGALVPLAFVADWVHVAAMATWLGGLAVLLVGPLARSRGGDELRETVPVLASFSEWALNAVTLLVATGLFAAWRNLRSFGALPATHYGRLLLWKSGVVVLVLVVARLSRRQAEDPDRTGDATLPLLRRSVFAEAGGAAVILAITAFLTGTAPGAQTYAPAVTRSATDNGVTVTLHVSRTGIGPARVLVTTTRGAGPQAITSIDGSLSELDPPVGPLPVVFHAGGPGREVATLTFPTAGDWSLAVDVSTSPTNRIAVATTIRVRG
ncbi:MAG TPA: copper resistance protein CopC [Mycobacteriales bacterium]|nr:copper resistance protein CopC [Mycobacteriales bacterium]